MLIKTRQKPPKDGWYRVEYDPKSPAVYDPDPAVGVYRAFFEGKWRRGKYPKMSRFAEAPVFSRCENDKYNLSDYKPFLEQ